MATLTNPYPSTAPKTPGAGVPTSTTPASVKTAGGKSVATPGFRPSRVQSTAPADQPGGVNANLFTTIAAFLTDMGLGDLFTFANGVPGGWLWDQITSGINDANVIQINLEKTAAFQREYGVIGQLRQAALTNPSIHVPSVAEVREYRQTIGSIFRQANLPAYMYDDKSDFDNYMKLNLSASEIESRVGATLDRVRNTDPLVRDVFNSWFGASGDAALAAVFLDPHKSLAQLDRMSRTAYTGGMGLRLGVNIDQATAERIAGTPSTDAGIYQDLGTVAGITKSGILTEGFTETNDLTDKTAIDATFFGDGGATTELQRRVKERQANDAASVGGALRTNRGVTGLGTARTP